MKVVFMLLFRVPLMVGGGVNINPSIGYGGIAGQNICGLNPYYGMINPQQWTPTPRPMYNLPQSQTDPTCVDGIGQFIDMNL